MDYEMRENIKLTGNFEKRAESLECDVVVQLARRQEVVLDDRVVEDGRAVRSGRLLVAVQPRLEILQLRPLDESVEVHLFQDAEVRQCLAALVLVQDRQHPAPLLAGVGQDRARHRALQRRDSLLLVNDGLVAQLVVPGRRLDKLALVVENSALTHLKIRKHKN